MTSIGVVIPSVGRETLLDTLASVAEQLQPGDRATVVCDAPGAYDFCSSAVDLARTMSFNGVTWRCFPSYDNSLVFTDEFVGSLGCFGHPARNLGLDLFASLDVAPDWCWSLDDDDVATFGALDMVRSACSSGDAGWYVFRMRGGAGSHFPNVTVPTMGDRVATGNVGTPMIVFPVTAKARFGVAAIHDASEGYFGDYEMAVSLQQELGRPAWIAATVAEIRPEAVA